MSTTWAQFLKDLREDLQDSGSSPRWTSYLLWLYTKDAINDYSLWFPRRIDSVELVASGTGYALPDDFSTDIYVESPKDTFLERRLPTTGRKFLAQSSPYFYYLDGGKLYLNSTTVTDGPYLTYYAIHDVPTSEKTTPTFTFTIPDSDLELIRLYVRAQVHTQMRSKQARLDRFEPGSGRRDDNPLHPEANTLLDEYYNKVSLRVGGGAVRLHRTGRIA